MNDTLFEKKRKAIKVEINSTSARTGMTMPATKKVLVDGAMHRLVTGGVEDSHGSASAFCSTARANDFVSPINNERDDASVAMQAVRAKMRFQQKDREVSIVLKLREGPGVSLGGKIASMQFAKSVIHRRNGKADSICR